MWLNAAWTEFAQRWTWAELTMFLTANSSAHENSSITYYHICYLLRRKNYQPTQRNTNTADHETSPKGRKPIGFTSECSHRLSREGKRFQTTKTKNVTEAIYLFFKKQSKTSAWPKYTICGQFWSRMYVFPPSSLQGGIFNIPTLFSKYFFSVYMWRTPGDLTVLQEIRWHPDRPYMQET